MSKLERAFDNDGKEEWLKRIFINELEHCINQKVLLMGWVHKITDLSHVVFIKLRDKSGLLREIVLWSNWVSNVALFLKLLISNGSLS